jgi:hypothetical protein
MGSSVRAEMRYPLEQKDRATIERLFRLMDEAEAKGISETPYCSAVQNRHR